MSFTNTTQLLGHAGLHHVCPQNSALLYPVVKRPISGLSKARDKADNVLILWTAQQSL